MLKSDETCEEGHLGKVDKTLMYIKSDRSRQTYRNKEVASKYKFIQMLTETSHPNTRPIAQ